MIKALLQFTVMGAIASRQASTVGFSLKNGFSVLKTNNSYNPIKSIFDQLSSIENFLSSVQDPSSCQRLIKVIEDMDKCSLQDLGFSQFQISRLRENQCCTIYSSPLFDISVFIICKGKGLPVHNHPSMAVLSKVVCGELNVRSYTPKDYKKSIVGAQEIPVTLALNGVKTASDSPWFLTPSS